MNHSEALQAAAEKTGVLTPYIPEATPTDVVTAVVRAYLTARADEVRHKHSDWCGDREHYFGSEPAARLLADFGEA